MTVATRLFSVTFNSIILVIYGYSFYWIHLVVGITWKLFTYLTIWMIIFHIFCLSFFAVRDACRIFQICRKKDCGERKQKQRTSSKCDETGCLSNKLPFAVFHVAMFFTLSVTMLFWIVYYIDPQFIVADGIFFPRLLTHTLHTLPSIVILAQIPMMAKHESPAFPFAFAKDQEFHKMCVLLTLCIHLFYLTFIALLNLITGTWPYPLLEQLTASQFACFILSTLVICAALSYALSYLAWSCYQREINLIEISKKKE